MAGALIVEGGLDDQPQIREAKEQVLVLQQLSYDQAGTLENFDVAFAPGRWQASGRGTTVNGQVAPTIVMRPGEVQRWRIVHAGTRENIALRLEGHPLNEVAVDGIALGRMVAWSKSMLLSPGDRTDVMVQAGRLPSGVDEQSFDLVDDALPAQITLQGQQSGAALAMSPKATGTLDEILARMPPKPAQVLAHVVVRGAPLAMTLPRSEELARYAPLNDITDAELTGEPQQVMFDVSFGACGPDGVCKPCHMPEPGCSVAYTINGREFNDGHVRKLKLGQAAEWSVGAKIAVHPFHIHVNPFQTDRLEPDGQMHLVWRDTLLVMGGRPPKKLRMRYEDFTGTTVLHCHILDHEDQGMMELIEFDR